jgi:S-methylmethionine-dependent homocysteine/selenocysteine methylase
MPVAVSFTLDAEGVLLSELALQEAIQQTVAATDSAASYFTVNCTQTAGMRGSSREHLAVDRCVTAHILEIRGSRSNLNARLTARAPL